MEKHDLLEMHKMAYVCAYGDPVITGYYLDAIWRRVQDSERQSERVEDGQMENIQT